MPESASLFIYLFHSIYPDPMPVSVSVYTGHTLQCTLCIHCSGASAVYVKSFLVSPDIHHNSSCITMFGTLKRSIFSWHVSYTVSVRPVYTGYTELGSGYVIHGFHLMMGVNRLGLVCICINS